MRNQIFKNMKDVVFSMNKGVLLLFLLLLAFFVSADTITNYVVPDAVPLNQEVTATGIYADAGNNHPVVLCSFYILQGSNLVYRATDQYSTTTGRFSMAGKVLNEPIIVRGQNYTLRSDCGSTSADANFFVGQKQETFDFFGFKFYPQGATMDFLYFKDNGLMVFFLFIMIFVFIGIVVLGAKNLFG